MSKTAQELIRTASKRLGDLILSTPTSPGTITTLVDSLLRQYLQTLTQANLWVYGGSTVDVPNRGQQRRAAAYTRESNTVSFEASWPNAITLGTYEIHPRYDRTLILEWLNDAVGQLGIYWFREVRDQSLLTADLTMAYTLPAAQYWTKVNRIELEVNTSGTVEGFPFVDAGPWNPHPYPYTDQFGNRTWTIQFGLQPPPDRILRVFGEAYYPELTNDGDVLALAGQYERPAMSYIFDWINYRAKEYDSLIGYTTETQESRQKMYDSLNKTREWLTSMLQPTHSPAKVVTPGHGDGMFSPFGMTEDPNYFGALNGLH